MNPKQLELMMKQKNLATALRLGQISWFKFFELWKAL